MRVRENRKGNRVKKSPGIGFLFWILLLCPISALGQSDTGGSIAGQVKDYGGRLFPALITLRNAATGIETQTLSDRDGHFHFAEVAPGTYSMRVNAPGCAPWKTENLNVAIGEVTQLNPQLSLALPDPHERRVLKVSQDDTSPAISDHVAPDSVDGLPNDDHHWSSLAVLSSGVTPGDEGELSFRGLSPLLNSITVDGLESNLAFHASERGSANGGYATAQASINEFKVSSSNFSAEYGRAAGGLINTVTRSGSNRLHGQVSAYYRDANWGTTNPFTTLTEQNAAGDYVSVPYKPSDIRRQVSASAGGRIRRNKLFWFLAYDQHQRNFPGVARAEVPESFFAAPSAQDIDTLAARIGQSPAAAHTAYLNVTQQLAGLLGSVPRSTNQWILFPKLDWQPNNRMHFSVQYNRMRRTAPNGALTASSNYDGITSFGNSTSNDDTAIARWDYFLKHNLLNSARYQYSRALLAQTASKPSSFEQALADNVYGLPPQIHVDGSSGFTFGTRATTDMQAFPRETRQQIADTLTWIHHRHALKFGYDYNYIVDNIEGLRDQTGSYSYSKLLNFVSDLLAPNSCDGSTLGAGKYPCYSYFQQATGLSDWSFQTADYAGFAADEWKIAPRFMLSLGVRYEYQAMPVPSQVTANPALPQTMSLPHDRNNFGPRAGLSWDLFHSGKTVLSAGYGIYYGRIPNATIYSALSLTGNAQSTSEYYFRPLDTGAPPFSYVFGPHPYIPSNTPEVFFFDKHFQNPQINQMEISLEQHLGPRTAITFTYMSSISHELPYFVDTNIDTTSTGLINYAVDDPQHLGPLKNTTYATKIFYKRLNPGYNSITDIVSESNARYQGAVLRVRRNMARSISINAGYTYSHATDDDPNLSTFSNHTNIFDPTNPLLEHGPSNFDVRQRAAGGVVLHEPWQFRHIARKLFNGYTLAASGEWRTGLPYSMRTTGSIPSPACSYLEYLQSGQDCAAINDPGVIIGSTVSIPGLGANLNGSGGDNFLPQVGRNTYRYPSVANLNARFAKRTTITERMSVEFMAEAFNVMNHENVTSTETIGYFVDNSSTNTNSGRLTYLDGANGTAAFGSITNANSGTFYRQRQFQAGLRLNF